MERIVKSITPILAERSVVMEIEAISAVKNSYRQQIAQQDFQQRAEDKRVQSEQPLTISKLSNNDTFFGGCC